MTKTKPDSRAKVVSLGNAMAVKAEFAPGQPDPSWRFKNPEINLLRLLDLLTNKALLSHTAMW
jgi:hypothetical protein